MIDERKFREVIDTIKGAERDKERFCKAARIEIQPMSNEQLRIIMEYITLCFGMLLLFGFFFMFFYFIR